MGFPVSINIMGPRIVYFATTGEDDSANTERKIFLLIVKLDGIGRTEFFTGPALTFFEVNALFRVKGVLKWNGLGILDIGRLALVEPCIIFINDLFRALFRAYSTGYTFVHIHIPWILGNFDLKVPFFPGYVFHL